MCPSQTQQHPSSISTPRRVPLRALGLQPASSLSDGAPSRTLSHVLYRPNGAPLSPPHGSLGTRFWAASLRGLSKEFTIGATHWYSGLAVSGESMRQKDSCFCKSGAKKRV